MWLLFGFLATAATLCNVGWGLTNRDVRWCTFVAMSFTALTVCAFYAQDAAWVAAHDWGALLDVTPATSTTLWALVILSIVLNSIPLIKDSKVNPLSD